MVLLVACGLFVASGLGSYSEVSLRGFWIFFYAVSLLVLRIPQGVGGRRRKRFYSSFWPPKELGFALHVCLNNSQQTAAQRGGEDLLDVNIVVLTMVIAGH